ncbi:MAG: hypothetical protein OXB97_04495 [Rhodospirillales bacterium]|nr:hypothetical protein [Rhodospirillales bacterium]
MSIDKPKAFTLRILRAENARWLDRLEASFPGMARTKAVWTAVRDYPRLVIEVQSWRERALNAERALADVAEAHRRRDGCDRQIRELLGEAGR